MLVRSILLGTDSLTGKNYDHRKLWIEEQLHRLAASFGIDLPNEYELNSIRNDPVKLAQIRSRLSDVGWWMHLLCQNVGTRADIEDCEVGKFWQSRYKSVRILDEETLLACAAYVDLNPIGPHISRNGRRCSDKGFLALTQLEYFEVLDWAARITVANKRGSTPPEAPPVLERLGIDPGIGSKLVQDFGRLFSHVAGKPKSVSDARSLKTRRRFYLRHPKPEQALA